jgi:beta-1,4-N-acetylglucosaminyltransferase
MIEVDLDFVFFSVGIFLSLPIFWMALAQRGPVPTASLDSSVKKISTMVVLGSGGHTTEILRLTSALNKDVYQPRTFIIAETDSRSEEKLRQMFPGWLNGTKHRLERQLQIKRSPEDTQ